MMDMSSDGEEFLVYNYFLALKAFTLFIAELGQPFGRYQLACLC